MGREMIGIHGDGWEGAITSINSHKSFKSISYFKRYAYSIYYCLMPKIRHKNLCVRRAIPSHKPPLNPLPTRSPPDIC